MKPEKQRIAIAESCGWKWVQFVGAKRPFLEHPNRPNTDYTGPRYEDPISEPGPTREGWTMEETFSHWGVPDFINDLNAIYEAEKIFPLWLNPGDTYDKSEIHYFHTLQKVVGGTSHSFYRATAAQRAEAFLKTLSLWKE